MKRNSMKNQGTKGSKRNSLISNFFKKKQKKPEIQSQTPRKKSPVTDTTTAPTPTIEANASPFMELENFPRQKDKIERKAIRKKLEIEYEDHDNAIKIGTKQIRENSISENPNKSRVDFLQFDELFGNKDFAKVKNESEESETEGGETKKEGKTLGDLIYDKQRPGLGNYNGNTVFVKDRKGKYRYKKKIILNKIKVRDNNVLDFGEDRSVYFPYEPYQEQKKFIEALYGAVDKRQNALLESPTGTGKTLSILTGALGWLYQKHEKKQNLNTKIFYASRTHSQIKQLVKELKATCYQPIVAILGSRDQLCINKELSDCSGSEKNNRCGNLVSMGECSYQSNLEKNSKNARRIYSKKILDIEELVTEGRSEGFCPFYLTRNLIRDAHIIFLPYNYLTHKEYRIMLKDYIRDSILIFDEGHNIEGVAEDGNSVEFRGEELQKTIEDFEKVTNLLNRNNKSEESSSRNDKRLGDVCRTISDLRTHLKKKVGTNRYFSKSFYGEQAFNIFGELLQGTGLFSPNVQFNIVDTEQLGTNLREKSMLNLTKNAMDISGMVKRVQNLLGTMSIGFPFVEKWAKFLEKLIKLYKNYEEKSKINAIWSFREINHFTLSIQGVQTGYRKTDVKMTLRCLTPKFTFKQISDMNPISIIFSSGTLQPMNDYEYTFDTKFDTKFSCGHVINGKKQLKALVIKNLGGKIKANFNYSSRSNPKLIDELGNFIFKMAQVTPKGMVIFFPSYKVMDDYHERWKSSRLLYQLRRLKVICKEDRNQKKFRSTFKKFLSNYQTKGAIFFGVTSGKLSEGIDFTDEMARMVMMIGVPFPNMKDPKIDSKKKYLNQVKREAIELKKDGARNRYDGDKWYFVTALRAANQAIGRIIRHKRDFGTILLVDERYSYSKYQREISSWVSKELQMYSNSDDCVSEIRKFYKEAEAYCSKFEVRQALKGKSLQQRILESGDLLQIDIQKFKNLKRSGSRYLSLDKEKELKRSKRNSFYQQKKKEEKEEEKNEIEMENFRAKIAAVAIDSEDDIEEVDIDDAPVPQLYIKTNEQNPKKEIIAIEAEAEPKKAGDKLESNGVDFIPDLYQKMIPKERKYFMDKDKLEDLQCLICYSNPTQPAGAKCGHIACKSCWESQLKINKLECPLCRKKVRSKNLISIVQRPDIIQI